MARSYGPWRSAGSPVNQGGQGEIFEVTHANGTPCGIWLLKRLKNPKRQVRFERELKALTAMTGVPNVVQIVDSGAYKTDKIDYYVMERGDGSLSELAPERGYEPEKAFKLFSDILSGVEALHVAGVIHRDLKPDNVILFGETAKIGDPGLCLLVSEERVTPTDEAVGPRFYMAPELEHGRNLDVDIRADIYSLGKMLYWLLSAGVNLPRERFAEQQYALHLTRAPALASFANVFAKSLTPHRALRYASVAAFRVGFEEAVAAYRAHPDTLLMETLKQIPSRWASLSDALSQLDYEERNALVKRAEVGLLRPLLVDLIALAKIEPRLRNERLLKLLSAHAPLLHDHLVDIMHSYFEDDESARTVAIGLGVPSEMRTSLVNCTIASGNLSEVTRLARVGGFLLLQEPQLLPGLLTRLAPPVKVPVDLVAQLATSASFDGKAALMYRAASEADQDPEALSLALTGLAKSNGVGVEEMIRDVIDRIKSNEELLKQSAPALIISEMGMAVLRRLVEDVGLSSDTRGLLRVLLDLAEQSATGQDTHHTDAPD